MWIKLFKFKKKKVLMLISNNVETQKTKNKI